MMQNPNLIKRPILIKGSRVIFGFDKERYQGLAGAAKDGRRGGGS